MKVGGEDSVGGEKIVHFSIVTSPEDEAIEAIVGKIAMEFARLEHIVKAGVELAYRRTRNRSDADVTFSDGMGLAEKERTFESICAVLRKLYVDIEPDSKIQQAFAALVDEILRLARIRNAIIHSAFSATDDGRYLLLRSKFDKPTKTLKQAAFSVTLEELDDLFRTINYVRFLLAITLDSHTGTLGATVPLRKTNIIEGLAATAVEF